MKRFLVVFFGLLFVFSLNFSAFAVEGEGETQGEDVSVTETVVPDIYITNEIDTGEDLGEYVGTTVYSLNPVGSGDATGLKSIMLALIGDWDSIIIEHEYASSNGYTNYLREVQLDYPWLCSCAIFLVMIYCLFRLGGSILCRK